MLMLRAYTGAAARVFLNVQPGRAHGMDRHGLLGAAHALYPGPGASFNNEVCAGVPVAAVRGVMFASYPANAPVGPSDPSQYPKQGPHQFKPVRARRPCVHPLSPAPDVHAMHGHLPPLTHAHCSSGQCVTAACTCKSPQPATYHICKPV